MDNQRVYAMSIARVYPLYVAKVERKGRTKAELDDVIRWMTGHDDASLQAELEKGPGLADFFAHAPNLNPARMLVTGVICGVRVETIDDPTMREIRILDKLVDEVAKGKAMAKILRQQAA